MTAVLVLAGAQGISVANAVPVGRAWAPIERITIAEFNYMPGGMLHVDSTGAPILMLAATILGPWGPEREDGMCLTWADTSWREAWRLGYCPIKFFPVVSQTGENDYMIWEGCQRTGQQPVYFGRLSRQGLYEADTVATFTTGDIIVAGAISGAGVRWAAIRDRLYGDPPFVLRVYRSPALGQWEVVAEIGQGWNGVAVAIEDDSTAIVVHAEMDGLHYGYVGPSGWTEAGLLPQYGDGWNCSYPRFELRSDGGYWLSVTGSSGGVMRAIPYRDGQWAAPETLRCAYPQGRLYESYHPTMSHEAAFNPVTVWMNGDVTGGNVVCACVPTDSGFPLADHIATWSSANQPSAARDLNGDAWVYWWSWEGGGYWTHTYTAVAAGVPRICGNKERRVVGWSLESPAPKSWWAVLRAEGQGAFTTVARVQAGTGTELSWTDTTPTHVPLRYQIRRECVDGRFRWESDAVQWPGANPSGTISIKVVTPFVSGSAIRVLGADAGPLTIEVFDLQGRLVTTSRPTADGTREDVIPLDLQSGGRPVGAGVYFARARDAAGRASPISRLVLLK